MRRTISHSIRSIIFFLQPPENDRAWCDQGGVQFRRRSQFNVLLETNLRLAIGPVLVPHQAEYGHQLRLAEVPLAELTPLTWQCVWLTTKARSANFTNRISVISTGKCLIAYRVT